MYTIEAHKYIPLSQRTEAELIRVLKQLEWIIRDPAQEDERARILAELESRNLFNTI